MAKKRPQNKSQPVGADLFVATTSRRRRALILPRYLEEEADKLSYTGPQQLEAFEILKKWAQLEQKGRLWRKETALDAEFLHEVFGRALGYKTAPESPEKYHLERNLTIPGIGTADAALGEFGSNEQLSPLVVIELKGAETDLDRDKFNGRTPVQQCWDYLNALPNCPWGIVSNFVIFRLYHRNQTPLAYQEFQLQRLRNFDTFKQFYCLFGLKGLVQSGVAEPPAAVRLLIRTENRQQEVGDKLYGAYSENRLQLIEELHFKRAKPLDSAIHIAQKILDRIIFIAFCEDRGLLPEKCIEGAYQSVPPFSKVTNPRWQNFLNLFHAIDKGHETLDLKTGYNGGLFRHDPDVDDLELDDNWTNFFNTIGTYDFRDEVNVDVLGHLFEKSVGELERLRTGAFFATTASAKTKDTVEPTMPKSPERKRFGIYYTPIQFTQFIVKETVGVVVNERFEDLRLRHQLTSNDLEKDQPSPAIASYWRDCLQSLRDVKVCDPACGSGAFLIQAYDLLEERYQTVLDALEVHDPPAASEIADKIPDIILAENIYGVDLSEQAVEITQLALWIRSARRGKTLADLSHNIVQGNSLVTDGAVHPRAMNWQTTFPAIFARTNPGFDCVIGNPPWERLKLQEREFFAFSAPRVAGAVSAAKRRQLIAELEKTDPELFAAYNRAKNTAESTLLHVRVSGEFPLTAKGDINTYMLFAELGRKMLSPTGRVGLLVPSGIATDNTTREFFTDLIGSQALVALYDFENRRLIFPDIDSRSKFCVLLVTGQRLKNAKADFVFFAHAMSDLEDKKRHISLSASDIALLNPNTLTCPIFRSARDAELTKAIYHRVPILIDESRDEGGNPWGIKFVTMFHQTNDAELFHAPDQLQKMGFQLHGNRWTKGKQDFLPLYEAKMIQAYDHRAASVVIQAGNWVRQGQTEETSLVDHQNPEFFAQPRWWVEEEQVNRNLKNRIRPTYLSYKDVTSATNQRTMIAAFIPHVAVVNSAPIMLLGDDISARQACCLLANLNSLALDFVVRQKVGGVHLNFFIVSQLPMFSPDRYDEGCPWKAKQTLENWISDRVLELTCTANDMRPLAEAAGFNPPVHKWKPAERAELMAELDAAFFRLYEIPRDDVEYILNTFAGIRKQKELFAGANSQADAILEAYDRLAPS